MIVVLRLALRSSLARASRVVRGFDYAEETRFLRGGEGGRGTFPPVRSPLPSPARLLGRVQGVRTGR